MSQTNLTLRPFLWRVTNLFPEKEIVSRTHEGITRYTYAEYAERVAQLSNALEAAGIGEGDSVGSFCWNHHRHFEAYFGVPDVGAALHTINVNLPDDHVKHLLLDAKDRLVFVDPGLFAQLERLGGEGTFAHVERIVVMGDTVPETDLTSVCEVESYESFIADHPTEYSGPELDEEQVAAMCHTGGTTGVPKGVKFTHKMLWTQMMATMTPYGYGFDESDVILQIVPMFHIHGWGWPYEAAALGTKLVLPGPSPDSEVYARLIEAEDVTFTGGVPTVWINFLEYLNDNEADISSLERVFNGGGRPPEWVIREFDEKYDVHYQSASGMTEVTALATTATLKSKMDDWSDEERFSKQQKAGLILPGMEFKAVDENGEEAPWDGETVGELYYRGPWVIDSYLNRPEANERQFEDGWFKTGDLVTVDEEGYIDIVDREDYMIKSGGEWISSVDLENRIMEHAATVEAAVVGLPHERWGERPLAVVVLDGSGEADEASIAREIEELIADSYPDWWVPDEFEFVQSIPRTPTEKFDKETLESQYRNEFQ